MAKTRKTANATAGPGQWGKKALPPRFDWQDVLAFLELSRQGQLVDAAERLGVNYTTVGRRVRELEAALKCKLFRRTPAGFVLTDAGQKILRHAEEMEAAANAVSRTVGLAESVPSGPVRVATMEGIGSYYFSPRLHLLHEANPALQVELVTAPRWINLSKREADIFISFAKPSERRLSVSRIGEFGIFLYASSAYLRRRGEPASLAETEGHDFVDYIDDLIEISAVRWLHDVATPRRVVFRSNSLVAQYKSASSGLGIAMLPSFVAQHNPDLRRILPEVGVKRDVWLSVHSDLAHIGRVQAVARFIAGLLERDRAKLTGQD